MDMVALFTDQEPQRKHHSSTATVLYGTGAHPSGQTKRDEEESAGTWGLVTIVLAGTYSGHILSTMLTKTLHYPFKSPPSLP